MNAVTTNTTGFSSVALKGREGVLRASLNLIRLGPVLILIVIAVVISLLAPRFLTPSNLQNVIIQTAPIAILAFGQLLVIVTRGIDLSVGAMLALSTVVGVSVFNGGAVGGGVVILTMLGTGLLVGLLNATILVRLRIPHPFIVTLGMLSVASGLALVISNGKTMLGVPESVLWLGSGSISIGSFKLGIPILVVAVAAILFVIFTNLTKWGQWIYAVGGNPAAAERSGIPVNWVLVSVYGISGVCAGLAAILVAGRTGAAFPTAGSGAELDAIAAVIIGGASFFGGRGTIMSALVGALVITTIRNGLNLIGVNSYWQLVAIGAVVIGAVALDVFRLRLEETFRRMQGARAA